MENLVGTVPSEEFRNRYREVNDSFSKTLVYHVGYAAGLFSELNMMLVAVGYCLKHKLRFKLFSEDANFAEKDGNGFSTFFIPFCEEVREPFHHRYNHRGVHLSWRFDLMQMLKFFPGLLYKKKYGFDFFTQELWTKIQYDAVHMSEPCRIDELGFEGTNQELFALLAGNLLLLNEETAEWIRRTVGNLHLPEYFVALHVRGGDKTIEVNNLPRYDRYLEKIKELTDCRELFLQTDDYSILAEIKERCPEWHLYSTAKPEDHGYYHAEFLRMTWPERKETELRVMTAVKLFCLAEILVGFDATNPSMFAQWARPKSNAFFLKGEWKQS